MQMIGRFSQEEDGVTMQDLFGADVEDEDLMEEPSPMSALEVASAKPQKRYSR